MARWWMQNSADPDELAYYKAAIQRFGEPALDVACGAGRLLVPLLEAGLDVEGADLSADMLAAAAETAESRGLPAPRLYQQAMHELDLPRRYRTIYICDSFGLGGFRDQDRLALKRIHEHLVPGGALVFNHYLPYDDLTAEQWAEWLPGHRREYPGPWPEEGGRRTLPDGDELELFTRRFDFDPYLQRQTLEMRIRRWHEGAVVAEESRLLHENMYFAQELLLMLADAGFANVEVEALYRGVPAGTEDSMVVFVAHV
jgi:SAM-dependent methyltransferase